MNPDGTGNQPSYGPDGQWAGPTGGYPQQGVPQQGYQQPGPPQYPYGDPWAQQYGQPQPGYAQPGYPQGYPQQGYGQPGPGWGAPAPEVKVGIVALRPLDLGDIYGGAMAAIRTNPGVMVGLTAVLVLVTQLVTFLAQIPMTRIAVDPDAETDAALGDLAAATGLSIGVGLIAGIASLFLTGVLTVAVARAVMGERTSAGEAVRAIGPRLLSLIGLSLLQFLIFLVPTALVVGLVVVLAVAAGDAGPIVAVLVAFLLFFVLIVGYLALLPMVSLAYPAVVLEQLGPIAALKRGYELQRPGFWRVLGILLLTYLITGIIGIVVSIPFGVVSVLVDDGAGLETLAGSTVTGLAIAGVGAAIAQILTVPFLAGVQTLLYVDQRTRNEQFDQVLRDEALRRWQFGTQNLSTDALWLQKPQAAPSSWY
ncbi:proline-rich domain-containing protein [Tsukamurella sp. USMM236]|uniref:proline-rich domain-containing protein n=1 Tax=Tsukamurella sp. USMM236 TaxID=3081301 RepID=UPI003016ABC4